ncbi:MAG: poly-gamma-glutamate synthase PgsB [Planctomycetota bacterium]
MDSELLLFPALAVVAIVWRLWRREAVRHERLIASIPVRIHVNGTRGKSTVTRIVAGMLREAGIETVAKCTGTAAAVIAPDASEHPIRRRGAPTILEQIEVIGAHASPTTGALVIECMALKPNNQHTSEHRIVRSTIGVITNVREDHQDVMGETRPEIARSLMNTCPTNGTLVTAEEDPEILGVMRREAEARGTEILVTTPQAVSDADVKGFSYFAFKDNIAIGLAIAELLGIDRETAMRGMQGAAPDPGVLRLRSFEMLGKRVTWANLFAVNDRESVVAAVDALSRHRTVDTTVVGILNNRADREQRATQFADIAATELGLDRIALLGAYEHVLAKRLQSQHGISRDRLVLAGEQRELSLGRLLALLVAEQPTEHVLLLGLANIHSAQASALLQVFEGEWHAG